MRILLWNCNGGIKRKDKIEYFKSFNADIAILPEIRKSHLDLLNPTQAVWATNNDKNKSPKGLGVISFNGIELQQLPRDVDMELYIPIKVKHPEFSFNLLAVWNFYWACKQGKFKGNRNMEMEIIKHFENLYNGPCLAAGDWNVGPTLKFTDGFFKIAGLFQSYGLTSLFHDFHRKPLHDAEHATYKHTKGNKHALDHFFGNSYFSEKMSSFEVGDFETVVRSDHIPLVLEIDLKAKK